MRWLGVALPLLFACSAARPGSVPPTRAAPIDRPVSFTLPQLEHPQGGAQIELPVGSGLAALTFQRTVFQPIAPGTYNWLGRTQIGGDAVISVRGGRVFGTIVVGTSVYRLTRGLDGKLHITRVQPPVRLPHRGVPYRHGNVPPVTLPDEPIDVLVAYTSNARTFERCGDIAASIQNAIAWMNIAAERSGAKTRFALAGTTELNIDESQSNIVGLLDTFRSSVAAERDRVGADVAILLIRPDDSIYDGVSMQTMPDNADEAFSIVNCDIAADQFGLAHEMGHLLGLNDDWDDPALATFKNGYGFAYEAADESQRWRTIMRAACSTPCTRIPRWSNPDRKYPDSSGATMGSADSDAAHVMDRTAGFVAGFRKHKP